jgi:hypothetical protein
MQERTSLRPEQVTHVFLTSLLPDHRRGVELFTAAECLVHEPERDAALRAVEVALERFDEAEEPEQVAWLRRDRSFMQRLAVAPDQLAPGVDLFPLPGVTVGTCGLLLGLPTVTVLIAGDAAPTLEHIEQGKVLPGCQDVEAAQESFREALEIADVIIPGRDNLVPNPLRRQW